MSEPLSQDEDSNSEVLEKLDALMRKHYVEPPPPPPVPLVPPPEPPAMLAPTLPKSAQGDEFDDIPVLTEVIEEGPVMPAPQPESTDAAARRLEARLLEELENRIAPQLSLALQQALDTVLADARRQIAAAVREHLDREKR